MKKQIILPKKILQDFYKFEKKSETHLDLSISDIEMFLLLTEYRDNYSEINLKWTDIKNKTGIKDKPTLNKCLKFWDLNKDIETGLYEKKMSDAWRIDTTKKEDKKWNLTNTKENMKNTNSYAALPINVYDFLMKNTRKLNLWKLTFFIVYKTYSDPHNDFNFSIEELLKRLMIPDLKQNRKYYLNEFETYLKELKELGMIKEYFIDNKEFIFHKGYNITKTKGTKIIPIITKELIKAGLTPKRIEGIEMHFGDVFED